jgi:hypothetical protein
LRLSCVRRRDLPGSAHCARQLLATALRFNNRSKFNVALGIEAQGFCLIK